MYATCCITSYSSVSAIEIVQLFLFLFLQESSTTTLTGSGDALLVDLLETQVESLKAKLEQTQVRLAQVLGIINLSLVVIGE